MSLWSKIIGTIESAFQVGLGGPQLVNSGATQNGASPTSSNAGVVAFDAQTFDGSAYVNVRAADPIIDDDLATKRYVDEQILLLSTVVASLIAALNANGIDLPLDVVTVLDERIH